MRTAISESQRRTVLTAVQLYRRSQDLQQECIYDLAEIFELDTDRAHELLEKHGGDSLHRLLDTYGIEVYDDAIDDCHRFIGRDVRPWHAALWVVAVLCVLFAVLLWMF